MNSKIFIQRIAERCGLTHLETMQLIENSMLSGKIDELLIIAGLKEDKADV